MVSYTNKPGVQMRRCPLCGKEGFQDDVDGYLLRCPECGRVYNEDDYPESELTVREEI